MQLERLTQEVVALCKRAKKEVIAPIKDDEALRLDDKDGQGRNFATQADIETERYLIEHLGKLLPECSFVAEESFTGKIKGEYQWIIDPIDGTTNFIHDLPPYCISIALAQGNKVLIGVIYELSTDECFYAWENGGAYLNGTRIHVSGCSAVSDSLLCTGFPYDYSRSNLFDAWMELVVDLMKASHGIRRLGSAAVDMAYVAAGRFDAFFEYDLHAWDVAAGSLIVQEAGGMVSDFSGGSDHLYKKNILVSNGRIHASILERMRSVKDQMSPL